MEIDKRAQLLRNRMFEVARAIEDGKPSKAKQDTANVLISLAYVLDDVVNGNAWRGIGPRASVLTGGIDFDSAHHIDAMILDAIERKG